jgi:gamma-glutamyltranspeptidase/glutathione hydrolase
MKTIFQSAVLLSVVIGLTACATSTAPMISIPPQKVMAGGNAMAVAAQPEATQAAAKILAMGGNAVDAAVAAGFAIATVEPTMNSIGGRSQILLRTADGEYLAINGMTEIPAGYVRPEEPDSNGYGVIATPGVVAALARLHEEQGSFPWTTLVQPAIEIAENGFVLLPGEAARHARGLEAVKDNPGFQQSILQADGTTALAGTLFKQPALGRTLRRIANDGAAAFYQGEIAEAIAADMSANGGFVTLEDLNNYRALDGRYISTTYRDVEIHTIAAPAGGGLVVKALNILENFDLAGLNDLEWAAVMNQALALSVRTMENDYEETDLAMVTSKEWAREAAKEVVLPQIQVASEAHSDPLMDIASSTDWSGDSWGRDSHHTTHFVTADCSGATVSITQTVGPLFGSKVITPELGFPYASTMGSYLATAAQSPGSRPRTTIAPTIVTRDGEVVMVLGAAGGLRILSGIVQTISRHVDQDLSLADAVAAPRVHPVTSTDVAAGTRTLELNSFHAELTPRDGWQEADVDAWQAAGFTAKPNMRDGAFARVHALGGEDGLWHGAADLDWEGSALAVELQNCSVQ